MADFGLIKPAFWGGERRSWSDAEVRLGLYLLSCEHRNLEGLYRLPLGYVVTDLDWPLEKVSRMVAKLVERGFCDYDQDAEVVFVCKSLKHQAPKGTPRLKGAAKAIARVPSTRLMGPFFEACRRYAPALWDELGQPTPDGPDTPSGPHQDGGGSQATTPSNGYSAAAHPETDTEPEREPEPEPEAAAAREHTREALRVETALGLLATRHKVKPPSAADLDVVLADYPHYDIERALDEVKRWAARACPSSLLGAFRSELIKAGELPVAKRTVAVSVAPAAAADVEHWTAARARLQERVSETAWDIYLVLLDLAGVDGDTIVLCGPGEIVGHLRGRYLPVIAETIGRPVQIIEAEVAAA
jgi:hypothetical protein